MKSNTSYLARLFGYVSSSIPYFLISFFGFVLFAAAQVGAAEWLRRIVDFIENPNQTVQTILPLALIAIALIRGIGFYLSNFLYRLILFSPFCKFSLFGSQKVRMLYRLM